MTTKSKQLVRAGHELASELKADCGAVDMRSVANLLTELASALDVQSARSDALETQLNEMAAENAELKRANAVALNILNDEDTRITSLWASSVHKVVSETPTTDAFLAEVRARAVDEACLKISNAIVNCYQDEQVGLDAAATICVDFAAQLRGNSNGGAL